MSNEEQPFDLLREQEVARNTNNQAVLFGMFNEFSTKYDKGLINKVHYEEMRDLIMERIKLIEAAKTGLEGIF